MEFLKEFFKKVDFKNNQQITKKQQVTVVPTKSDSDVILCLQLLSKKLTCILHLSVRKLIDHLCIYPILWIGLIHK